ncbi:MAG: hypothetical protein PVJ67_04905 [Candidatus Pacearchaeota archaeon]|jgi:hypothetical protein
MVKDEREEYEKIKDNTETGFETTTDKGLVQVMDFKLPSYFSQNDFTEQTKKIERAKIEMNRRLRVSIERFNKQSSEQSNRIFWLTIAMILLGFAQTLFLIYSIFK